MNHSLIAEAEACLQASIRFYNGKPVGTVAATEKVLLEEQLNYNECFIRDFFPCGLAFLMQGKRDIVKNFLEVTLGLQLDWENPIPGEGLFAEVRQSLLTQDPQNGEWVRPGQGLMPASFLVVNQQEIKADFGQRAIGRVTPVDSGLWWIFLLKAYEKACDQANVPQEKIAQRPEFQRGIKLLLELCLAKRFDMTPTLLVPEGAFMIDRRMGVYGHPLEIQALFVIALKVGLELLNPEDIEILDLENRLHRLIKYIRHHYWLDPGLLRRVFRYQTEEFGETALNKFNIYANTVPGWVLRWLDRKGGYLVGNLGVGWLDFRFFTQGNLLSIISCLTTQKQSQAILTLIEQQWSSLIGEMPMKICYPAVSGRDWEIITGCDPKNVPWSYHNGGNWPVLMWSLTAASVKMGQEAIANHAIAIAEKYLAHDEWPEYYDHEDGKIIGRQARLYQTWTISGYLVAQYLLQNPQHLDLIEFSSSPDN
ncbi:Plant neutral invertase superfamily [Planktothrix serta PCC 8927]|uniref:Plant neutral invertase superfamily n=1 Tax=Planktothrix serta PCC 8927 TaxID=671068 RepID=A0A7Z9E1B0_9CYAN|nr:glycoside hydrolase 100 family protein [Planktothrix serta]VXD17787.1 Plant neutral invertase superfamily [Planktothrix serta PCC 8927]